MAESTPDRWRRVVVEKPFGEDLPSSRELNELVDSVFGADDVFRIDHYLGKETVQNLLALRFANTLFEPIWNGHHVDSVQITMAEDVGIGGAGAVLREDRRRPRRAAEPPAAAAGADRDGGAGRVLRRGDPHREAQGPPRDLACPRTWRPSPSAASTSRAGSPGSGCNGYRQEDGVADDSTTETFAAVRLGVETRRWAGVPFYLRTGKRLPRRVTEIALVFKRAPHLPFADTDTEELGNNQLVDPGPARRRGHPQVRVEGPGQRDGGPRRVDGLPLRRAVHRVQPGGLRAAAARRAPRRRHALPPQRRGRGLLGGHRPARGVLGRARRRSPTAPASGVPRAADEMLAAEGRRWRRP